MVKLTIYFPPVLLVSGFFSQWWDDATRARLYSFRWDPMKPYDIMMAGNGALKKYETNHLQHGIDNTSSAKDYQALPRNQGPLISAGRNMPTILSSLQTSAGLVTISSNGQQNLSQPISLSIDDIADIVEKPEISNISMRDRNDALNEFEGEYAVGRDPSPLAKHDFLVSFLVDARGGSMYGCRNSGIKVLFKGLSIVKLVFLS